ncbi:very short patch repair endonuclease [Serinicoccus sp. CNJ-927]|uniref:very short patch repair endonuclease n=1 Tax=Serinicoccus sp. CNJ-927 TaxID=1904970 RepID=UPI00096AB7DF|nr:very short patch repair endonuclease [Serinicoccus sp. CNJ-927]
MGQSKLPRHPGASSAAVSARMSAAPRRDTAPEIALRRALHRAGRRFRVVYPVPGNQRRTVDIAFTRARLAVFVDGCFWHGCPAHGTSPKANTEWWNAKLATNVARDRDTDLLLERSGWRVLRCWEHVPVEEAIRAIEAALAEPSERRG